MRINDEMAAEPTWAGGGWSAEDEDGMGGIATRFTHRDTDDLEVPIYGYPVRPRHPHFTAPCRATEEKSRSRSPESVERARQARISRRRNAS